MAVLKWNKLLDLMLSETQCAEIERLQRCADALEIAETALLHGVEHMERARGILRKDEHSNWGMLDATRLRDALTAIDAAKNPEVQR